MLKAFIMMSLYIPASLDFIKKIRYSFNTNLGLLFCGPSEPYCNVVSNEMEWRRLVGTMGSDTGLSLACNKAHKLLTYTAVSCKSFQLVREE